MNTNLDHIISSDNGSFGILVNTGNTGRIEKASVTNVTANNNGTQGILFQTPNAGGTINEIYGENITANNNTSHGLYVRIANALGTVNSATFKNVTANGNGNNNGIITASISGLVVSDAGSLGQLNLTDITTINNILNGLQIQSTSLVTAYIGSTVIRNLTSNNNGAGGIGGHGLYVLAQTGGKMGTVELGDIKAASNLQDGVRVLATSANSSIRSVLLSNAALNNNTLNGVQIQAAAGAGITSAILDDVTSVSNVQNGIYISGTGANSRIAAIVRNSDVHSNQRSGMYFDNDVSGTGTFSGSIGSNTVASPGYNTLRNNNTLNNVLYGDLQLDLNNSGVALLAQYNWWGQAGGPGVGRVVSDPGANAGTANTSNPLGVSP